MPDLKKWLQSLKLDLAAMADGDGFDAADTLVQASLEYNVPPVYQFEVSRVEFLDEKRSIIFRIYPEDGTRYFSPEPYELTEYVGYLRAYGIDDESSNTVAENLRTYEEEVRNVFISKGDITQEGTLTIRRFGQYMKGLASSEKWAEAFENHTDNIYGATDRVWATKQAMTTAIVLAHPDRIGLQGLRHVMAWSLLRRLISYASGKDARCASWCERICASRVVPPMQVAIISHYNEILGSGGTMENIQNMTSRVRAAYEAALRATKWLNGDTLAIALRKFNNMVIKIGHSTEFPNASSVEAIYADVADIKGKFFASWAQVQRAEIRRLVRDQQSLITPLAEVNAYYLSLKNMVVIPSATLQPTLYFPQGPASVNYGSLGATIGHEITHAFDVRGFHVDDEGRVETWGPNLTDEVFLQKALCVRKQHYQIDPPRRQAVLDDFLDSENMADLVGLIIANDAFDALPPTERNMGVPNDNAMLSPEQAFFVSFCASLCDIQNKAQTGRYAIGPGRCMVPLMNNPRFAKAFGCGDTAFMNPSQKCSYW
ncbi:neprilysin-1-like [Amblyomma americanum]